MSAHNRVVQGEGQREGAKQRRDKEQRERERESHKCSNYSVSKKSEATFLIPLAAYH